MFCISLSDGALQRQAIHLFQHTDKILSEEMLVPAKPKYLGRSSSGSQASPENMLHGNAGKEWPEAIKLLGCRCSKSVPQPAPLPIAAGAGLTCPPSMGSKGKPQKASVALEVVVACREALLKHFMPVFR